MRSALHKLINMSWEEGKPPEILNPPNIYPPISLTSCVVRILERVIADRLETYIKSNRIIDAEQDGSRKKHSSTNAVLRLIQSIYNGFEKNMYTAAIFIDLTGAYDTS